MPAVKNKLSSNISFCAVLSALCVVLMLLCRVISITDYAISALCGIIIGIIVVECGKKWAIAAYVVVSLLGLLLGSNECAITFVIFLGYYPVVKVWLDKLNRVLGTIIKLVMFNLSVVSTYLLLDYLGFIPLEEIDLLGKYTNAVLLMLANIVFILYDFAFNGIMAKYYQLLHNKINNIIKNRR